MIRGSAQCNAACDVIPGSEQRSNQTALAEPGECDRVVDGLVRHDGVDWPERFDIVRRCTGKRLFGVEQHGRVECAGFRICAHDIERAGTAEYQLRLGSQPIDVALNVAHLCLPGERSHADAFNRRVADFRCSETLAQCSSDRINHAFVHERPPDGGALLARLRGHLARNFPHKKIKLLCAWRCVRAEHGEVERIGFLIEAHRIFHDALVCTQSARRTSRASERHRILAGEMIEQIAGTAADQLKCTDRQQP